MQKKDALAVIDDKQSLFTSVSDKIWEYAELSLLEYQSMELYCKVLAENGFTVEKGSAMSRLLSPVPLAVVSLSSEF